MTPRSAKNAFVRVGNATYAHQSWNVNPKADLIDTSNSESGGAAEYTAGFVYCDVSISGPFDAAQNPYDAPVGFQAGETISNVKLYLNGLAGPFWSFPTLKVESAPNKADVKQALMIDISGKAHGEWVYPTGAA